MKKISLISTLKKTFKAKKSTVKKKSSKQVAKIKKVKVAKKQKKAKINSKQKKTKINKRIGTIIRYLFFINENSLFI